MSSADEVTRLSRLAREHLGEDLGERWSRMLAPCARLVPRPDAPRGWLGPGRSVGPPVAGWLGGDPVLPVGAGWPVWEGSGPLAHVATLDCAQLYPRVPGRLRGAGFPAEGMVSFFYFDGSIDSGEVVGALFGTEDGARVVYTPAGVDVVELSTPAPLAPYRRVEVVAEPALAWPTWEHPDLRGGRLPPDGWDALVAALDEIERQRPSPLHQVGGHPYPVQGPVEVEMAYGRLSRGGSVELDWSDPAVMEGAREWLLLAQFDSDDAAGFIWGDGGLLYFMIRPEDLARLDFAEAGSTWQCS